MRKLLFICICGLITSNCFATVIVDTTYINRGQMTLIDGIQIPYWAFNEEATFTQRNQLFNIEANDSLQLTVINNDNEEHGFSVKNYSTPIIDTLLPNDTLTFTITSSQIASFIFYDHLNFPDNQYLGLAGQICFARSNEQIDFFWNIKEHQLGLNTELMNNNGEMDWTTYDPDYYTINSNSNPAINADPVARVTGSVGDTIYIYLSNTGRSIHSIHFHGYHEKIVYSSKFPEQVDWFKDSFQLYPMETLVLMLIPDKPGEYPVHDHNLVAVTSGNIYPNGMFTTLLITE